MYSQDYKFSQNDINYGYGISVDIAKWLNQKRFVPSQRAMYYAMEIHENPYTVHYLIDNFSIDWESVDLLDEYQ